MVEILVMLSAAWVALVWCVLAFARAAARADRRLDAEVRDRTSLRVVVSAPAPASPRALGRTARSFGPV